MMRIGFGLLGLVALSACVETGMQGGSTASPAILAALDTQADGFVGATGAGESFRIVSTAASSAELCRVVSIERPGRFEVESFCKAPGGQWR